MKCKRMMFAMDSIGHSQSAGQLKGIYVPLCDQEADRNLMRHRKRL
jgi:hypothetical protein